MGKFQVPRLEVTSKLKVTGKAITVAVIISPKILLLSFLKLIVFTMFIDCLQNSMYISESIVFIFSLS